MVNLNIFTKFQNFDIFLFFLVEILNMSSRGKC